MATSTCSTLAAPHNLDAERNVLGACLLHAAVVPTVAAVLSPKDFYLRRHEIIFHAILVAHSTTGTADPIVVGDELARRGQREEAGGHEQLLDLLESVVTAAGVDYHANIVLDYARRRRLLDLGRDLQVRALDGETATDLVAGVESRLREVRCDGARQTQNRTRSWRDVALDPPIAWSIDGLEPAGGNLLLAGEPGSGKTLLAIDKALRKAHGMDWLGRKTRPGSTLYLAGEGTHGLGARLRAWIAAHPNERLLDGRYVELVDFVPDLTRADAVEQLDRLIETVAQEYGHTPTDVTIDTLAMATPGADENDAGPVGAVQAVLAEIRRRHGCSTTVLHHLRKPSTDRPGRGAHAVRGSSAIVGAADVVLIAAAEGDDWTLTTVKVRDGELLAPIPYQIRAQVTDVTREDGRPEAGPVVLPATLVRNVESPTNLDAEAHADIQKVVAKLADLGSASSANSVVRRVPGNRQNLLAAFREAVDEGLVLDVGTTRAKKYVVAGAAGSAAARAASPQTPGGSGTGNRPEADPIPEVVPEHRRNQPEPPGTGLGELAVPGRRQPAERGLGA